MSKFALFLGLFLPLASAQQYTISTVAGIGLLPFGGAGASGTKAFLIAPNYVAADSNGNTYVSDTYYQQVFKIDTNGIISVYAGLGQPGYSGDGGSAKNARLNFPAGLAFDSAGNFYIADSSNAVVRKVTPDGLISTVAGNYTYDYKGDGGSAKAAAVGDPEGVAVDASGNFYISQGQFNVIRKVTPSGMISTIAGTGVPGFSGDGGPASAAMLYSPFGLKVDGAGNLYIADHYNNRIRTINPQGVISTFAGIGTAGNGGNGAPATAASIYFPTDMAIDAQGDLYFSDSSNFLIRMVTPDGIIQAFAGGGLSLDDGPANQARLQYPTGLAIDSAGNIIVALNIGRQVRQISPQGAIATLAGIPPTANPAENLPALSAPLVSPFAVVPDGSGNMYISDNILNRILIVSTSGTISTFAGDGLFGNSPDNGPAIEVGGPRGLAFDGTGNLYAALGSGFEVQRITPGGTVNTVAGGGAGGVLGDGGSALNAGLGSPNGIALDTAGNLYIAEFATNRIRRVDIKGTITTIAGTGTAGYSGDNGPATSAQIYQPFQIAVDNNGNIYVADYGNSRIREITPDGTIKTVAGTGVRGYTGDGGAAINAQLFSPTGVAVDAAGNLYIADTGNSRIRKVNTMTGVITSIAGNGNFTFSGDGGAATIASLNGPSNLAFDSSGNLYFIDAGNYRIRLLKPAASTP